MTIRLDHTIVPARDKAASAQFFADLFGLTVSPGTGYFRQVRVNESLTLDFADADGEIRSHHYAFHLSDEEFDQVFARVQARGLTFGSGPSSSRNGRINTRRGGRGFYFEDPDGHLLEVMTVPETGSTG